MTVPFFKKKTWILIEIAIALVRLARARPLEGAKIEAAILYIKAIDEIRKLYMSTVFFLFGLILLVNMVTVSQVIVIFYAPWELSYRVAAAIGLDLISFLLPLLFMICSFSQEKWMQNLKGSQAVGFALGEKLS